MSNENDFQKLEALGYSQFYEDSRLRAGASLLCIARITAEHKGAYEIVGPSGEHRASVSGKFLLDAHDRVDYPAVGDWVVIKDNAEETKIIEAILQRRTVLKKKYSGKDDAQLIAANVDVAFIVESMDRDYSVNRFERYIVLAMEGGVEPVIILNKSDLIADDELDARIAQLKKRFPNVAAITTSSQRQDGLSELTGFIRPGVTYCFLGSSGVGKSTIINSLLDTATIRTEAIGAKTGRGRHITTARDMYFMANGGIIIDNPGSREVGLVDFGDGSKKVFSDIETLANNCKYKDCSHVSEPGCAVLAALESGEADAAQYDNYLKLRKEAEHYDMSSQEKRQKDRQFGKFIKHAKEDLKRYKPR